MSKITTRLAQKKDMARLIEIEAGALPSTIYLAEVEDEFFDSACGALIVAEIDGVVAGFAHYSIQYDNAAWIETLRVDPLMQKSGAGAYIWDHIMNICKELNPPAIRMYTNIGNDGSIKLAYRNKLGIKLNTHEYALALKGLESPLRHDFKLVEYKDIEKTLAPFKDGYHGYYFTNRTFYEMNDDLYKALAADGKVWAKEDAVVVVGSRYRHNTALHVGMLCGNVDDCIDFAVAEGIRQGVPKVVCMVPHDRQDLADQLRSHGFGLTGNDIIMMERIM
ncbi:MAG: GNAT family N-acetyltransferase [Clostridia bacterium]|nr:GNAT family N-acetyltransferase [Clostridia bacterium]